ncbi:MAG: cell division protein FtsZ [Flavobacteriales bacterium]|jgi:cell division protein FtsZ
MEHSLRFDLPRDIKSIIKVIGVGGGGSNAVNYMHEQGIKGVDFIVCNTDAQALDSSPVPIKVQLGGTLTEGRGAGAMPEVGRNAAIESLEEIRSLLSESTNMVFVTAGMGGGTGTGAAPVIAKLAKDMGILTVGIITVPFMFEGRKRSLQAKQGIDEMRRSVDTLLIIRNDKLRELFGNLTLKQAFSHADEVLCTAAKGIAEVITLHGTVNVDMNDVKTVMRDSGVAIMGRGRASGDGRAMRAVQTALESPLLNDSDIHGANFILLNVTFGTEEPLMDEISEITDYIQNQAGLTAEVIWGYGCDESLGEDICITVVATGFVAKTIDHILPESKPEPRRLSLEAESPKEITQQVESPTASAQVEVPEPSSDEPFLKNTNVEFEIEPPVQNKVISPVAGRDLFDTADDFAQESSMRHKAEPVTSDEAPRVFRLDEPRLADSASVPQEHLSLKSEPVLEDRPSRAEVSVRNKERENRIREFTAKLKSPSGLADMENEPAYLRRKVTLDQGISSSDSSVSRFTLNESVDENGEKKVELRNNNPFLHDQAD